jgi:hypothetical protein
MGKVTIWKLPEDDPLYREALILPLKRAPKREAPPRAQSSRDTAQGRSEQEGEGEEPEKATKKLAPVRRKPQPPG